MIKKYSGNRLRYLKRRKIPATVASLLIFVAGTVAYAGYMTNDKVAVDPIAFQPLLQLIAQVESDDNYNAYFGNASNTAIDLTNMSLAEVLTWQKDYVKQGSPSSAVGRYQIISTTLKSLIQDMKLDMNQKFDPTLQDRMAMTLLERRGASQYVNDELSREEFAANLAKEWAALPKVTGNNPQESYYASDGLNRSLVSISEILSVITKV